MRRIELELDRITVDDAISCRDVLDETAIQHYGLAMVEGRWDWARPEAPLTVFFDGERYWLADGFHRERGARRAEIATVVVEVHEGGRREAELYAAGSNKYHGVPRTNGTKRNAVLRALQAKEYAGWTQVQIAASCGVSQQYVSAIAAKMSNREHNSCIRDLSSDEKAGIEAETAEPKHLVEDDAREAVERAPRAEPQLPELRTDVAAEEAAREATEGTPWAEPQRQMLPAAAAVGEECPTPKRTRRRRRKSPARASGRAGRGVAAAAAAEAEDPEEAAWRAERALALRSMMVVSAVGRLNACRSDWTPEEAAATFDPGLAAALDRIWDDAAGWFRRFDELWSARRRDEAAAAAAADRPDHDDPPQRHDHHPQRETP